MKKLLLSIVLTFTLALNVNAQNELLKTDSLVVFSDGYNLDTQKVVLILYDVTLNYKDSLVVVTLQACIQNDVDGKYTPINGYRSLQIEYDMQQYYSSNVDLEFAVNEIQERSLNKVKARANNRKYFDFIYWKKDTLIYPISR